MSVHGEKQPGSPMLSTYKSHLVLKVVADEEKGGTLTDTRQTSHYALLSMILLVFQGTALSIVIRYSRTRGGQPYLASVSGERVHMYVGVGGLCNSQKMRLYHLALPHCFLPPHNPPTLAKPPTSLPPSHPSVLFTEIIKLAICVVMHLWSVWREAPPSQGQAISAFLRDARREAGEVVRKATPMALPAGMFVMQQVCAWKAMQAQSQTEFLGMHAPRIQKACMGCASVTGTNYRPPLVPQPYWPTMPFHSPIDPPFPPFLGPAYMHAAWFQLPISDPNPNPNLSISLVTRFCSSLRPHTSTPWRFRYSLSHSNSFRQPSSHMSSWGSSWSSSRCVALRAWCAPVHVCICVHVGVVVLVHVCVCWCGWCVCLCKLV
jgi:hypothetical protein